VATSNETLGEKPDSEDALRAECGVWRAPSRPAHSGCKLLHKRAIACIVDIPPPPMYNSLNFTGKRDMERAVLHIDGMSCGHCLNAVNQALARVPGVQIESVRIGRAEVSYDEGRVTPALLEAAVADAGYRATLQA